MKELVMKSLITNLNNSIAAIKLCIDNKLIMPALILLYSGIDVVGALERKPGMGTKASFIQWVDSYMFKAKPLHCSAIELYGARCGLLHTMAAESDLSRSGKARQVTYAWGSAKSKDLSTASRLLNRTDIVSVHVNELFDSFKYGLVSHFKEIDEDETRRSLVMKNAGIWLTDLAHEPRRTIPPSKAPHSLKRDLRDPRLGTHVGRVGPEEPGTSLRSSLMR